jgi:hypothetical protein
MTELSTSSLSVINRVAQHARVAAARGARSPRFYVPILTINDVSVYSWGAANPQLVRPQFNAVSAPAHQVGGIISNQTALL